MVKSLDGVCGTNQPRVCRLGRETKTTPLAWGEQRERIPKAAWGQLVDELVDGPDSRHPARVSGDSGYGNEGLLPALEGQGPPWLGRLRQPAKVPRLMAPQPACQAC
jgi:hypothetical protein